MSSAHCGSCGPTVAEIDDALGHTVCTLCGQVIEENAIVADLSFTEKASGAAVADGFSIGKNQSRAKSLGKFGAGTESRERVLENGNRRIAQIAHSLNMSNRYIETAQRYFNLAVANNFNKGRRTSNVAAACLYVVCRMEKTSHMLIDFSDVLQTNVYVLGATFLKLVQLLHLNLPLVDPALYIARFAARLEFHESTQKIISDSLRLVQRMNRDWMQIGRRPAGICAAALFIAARMNGFQRTHQEIIHTVKICEATLRKRLEEFKQTPSGQLSVQDFQNVWLEQSVNPPAFQKKSIPKSKVAAVNKQSEAIKALLEEEQAAAPVSSKKRVHSDNEEDEEEQTKVANTPRTAGQSQATSPVVSSLQTLVATQQTETSMTPALSPTETLQFHGSEYDEEDEDFDEDDFDGTLESEMQTYLEDDAVAELMDRLNNMADDLAALDSDQEVVDALLTPDEIEFKSYIWLNENEDWLARQKEKELDGTSKPLKKSRKGTKKARVSYAASTPVEAAMNMVQAKPVLSRKINYAVLETILES